MLKNFIQKNIYGILGTIIFHMFLVIIFLIVKISDLRPYHEVSILIDFDESKEEIMEKIEKERKILQELDEKFNDYYTEDLKKNIAVNIAENDEFIKEGEELHKMALELQKDVNDQLNESSEQLNENEEPEGFLDQSEDKTENNKIYKGPTNITYYLLKRKHVRLPIPVYKCEGSGKVIVEIIVNQLGIVESAKINIEKSVNANECLQNTAKAYALKTRFNINKEAPIRQEGSIVYQFVAQ